VPGLQCWLPRASALLAPGGEKSPEEAFFFGCGRKSHMLSTAPSRRGMHGYTQSR
jgi:hypothetical protein